VSRGSDHALLEALQEPAAIFHLYNSTSPAQRKYVFGASVPTSCASPPGVRVGSNNTPSPDGRRHRMRFEYSPESFTSTELDFALEICEAVTDVWQPTPTDSDHPQPARHGRVRHAQRPRRPDRVDVHAPHPPRLHLISLHTHNDRGTGVAATELGPARRRRPRRGHALRQRRAHRQSRCRDRSP
jgi:2-isopropylmalate synthase